MCGDHSQKWLAWRVRLFDPTGTAPSFRFYLHLCTSYQTMNYPTTLLLRSLSLSSKSFALAFFNFVFSARRTRISSCNDFHSDGLCSCRRTFIELLSLPSPSFFEALSEASAMGLEANQRSPSITFSHSTVSTHARPSLRYHSQHPCLSESARCLLCTLRLHDISNRMRPDMA